MPTSRPSPAVSAAGGRWRRLWTGLWDHQQSPSRYLLRAWLADVPISLLIVLAVGWLTASPWPDFEGFSLPRVLFAMVLFAPIGETLLMAAIFWLLRFFVKRDGARALTSALIWAGLHSLASPAWGPQIVWAFLIFSACYVTWEKHSVWRAITMTAALHMLHNAVPAIALVFSRLTA